MCNKAVNRFIFFDSIPNEHKTQKMCNSLICKDPLSIRYALDQYKTQ